MLFKLPNFDRVFTLQEQKIPYPGAIFTGVIIIILIKIINRNLIKIIKAIFQMNPNVRTTINRQKCYTRKLLSLKIAPG